MTEDDWRLIHTRFPDYYDYIGPMWDLLPYLDPEPDESPLEFFTRLYLRAKEVTMVKEPRGVM